MVDDRAQQRDRSPSSQDGEEILLKRRRRLRSLSPPRRRRSVPFVPPAWKTYYKPMSDDEEVRNVFSNFCSMLLVPISYRIDTHYTASKIVQAQLSFYTTVTFILQIFPERHGNDGIAFLL